MPNFKQFGWMVLAGLVAIAITNNVSFINRIVTTRVLGA